MVLYYMTTFSKYFGGFILERLDAPKYLLNFFCDSEFHAYAIIRHADFNEEYTLLSLNSFNIYTGFVCIISIGKSIII